ncbi:MAG: hypothetical protein KDG89_08375 [Geminicoccaceae bacterium]|nr:hypothetical protein [Geminicoccaceae bacterium]
MILAAVGTFIKGFDELVAAADEAAFALALEGFAQIGHSSVRPRHLAYARFLDGKDLRERLDASRVLVCHGGMGLIGDGLRAGRHVVVLPRRGAIRRGHPANDQIAFCRRLAERFPIELCETAEGVQGAVARCLERPLPAPLADVSDVPERLKAFLQSF